MPITAAMVKDLRERTGAGMMECKRALEASGGDMDAAVEAMRKAGLARADKKAGRIAAEGIIRIARAHDGRQAAMVEINCETDFVAKGGDFESLSQAVADSVLEHAPSDLDALLKLPLRGDKVSVEAGRQALISKLGENIQVRRFHLTRAQNQVGVYLHGSRIGVIVDITGGDETLARDIAMHIAASRPLCINEDDVPGELLDKEREIFSAQAQASGKPPEIVDKMIQGRLKKYLGEITLLGQPFVKDPDKTVGRLLRESNAVVTSFVRFEVGEGLEKKTGNFADEVMAQVRET